MPRELIKQPDGWYYAGPATESELESWVKPLDASETPGPDTRSLTVLRYEQTFHVFEKFFSPRRPTENYGSFDSEEEAKARGNQVIEEKHTCAR